MRLILLESTGVHDRLACEGAVVSAVVCALLFVPFVWLASEAVIVLALVPVAVPPTATVIVRSPLVAPGASVPVLAGPLDVKPVVPSEYARLNDSLVQEAAQLFVTRNVYWTEPPRQAVWALVPTRVTVGVECVQGVATSSTTLSHQMLMLALALRPVRPEKRRRIS